MNRFKNMRRAVLKIVIVLATLHFASCIAPGTKEKTIKTYTSFGDDVSFLEKYTEVIQITTPSGNGKVALSAALQGRVMTSSSSGSAGRSYGWINRPLFESGDTLEHINAFGGEERFWLGPEGGQFSIFFKNGSKFVLESWQTPRLIDLEPYDVKSVASDKAVFTKNASLTNYSGFTFDLGIEREVAILSAQEIANELGLTDQSGIHAVGYQTTNTLTNTGDKEWKKETGLLSIWLLGMFAPSPTTIVVIPFTGDAEEGEGVPVNIYESFGDIPPERLVVKDSIAFFMGDGQSRSKIGLLPTRAKDILGAYDALNQTLTIVKYNKPEGVIDYVNSAWEIQENPYDGDVVNSYNDGPPQPGKKPLGPFYELETSSPALALKAGESGTHVQMTFHFEGEERVLNEITKQLLGVSLNDIKTVGLMAAQESPGYSWTK